MPITLRFNIGGNAFVLEGEFTPADAVPLVKEFLRGVDSTPTEQSDVDALTDRLDLANDAQEEAVAASTPA